MTTHSKCDLSALINTE